MSNEKTMKLLDSLQKTVHVLLEIEKGGLELSDIKYLPELTMDAAGLVVSPVAIIDEFKGASSDERKAVLVAAGEMALAIAKDIKDAMQPVPAA